MLAVGAVTIGTWVGTTVGAGGMLGEGVTGLVARGEQALAIMVIANKLRKNDNFFLIERNLLGDLLLSTIHLAVRVCISPSSITARTSMPGGIRRFVLESIIVQSEQGRRFFVTKNPR
jgi:hypothetical protein